MVATTAGPGVEGRTGVRRGWRRFRQGIRMRSRLWKPRLHSVAGRLRRQRVVHIIHVGKTGGSSIKEAIRGDIRGVHSVYQDVAPGTRIITHSHHIDLRRVPAGDEVVFFLRDPLERYVSGFNSRLREGRPRFYHPWTRTERRAFERFPTPDALGVALRSTDPETHAEAHGAMRHLGHIRTHLADWLGGPDLIRDRRERILLVGWTETLVEDFERLKAILGLPERCRLPEDPRGAHRAPGDQSRDLSEEAVENLQEWYRDDYELIDAIEALGITSRPPSVRRPARGTRGSRTVQG